MMKRLLIMQLCLISFVSFAQVPFKAKMDTRKGEEIICPANYEDANTFRDMPDDIKKLMKTGEYNSTKATAGTARANITVDYNNFTPQAQASFQRAINIWASILNSDVPVRVIAFYQPLGPSTLGSATAGDFNRNFPGAPQANTFYPIALAEKISGRELNAKGDYDIVCRFSSDAQWYFGTLTPAVGQFDFESVVLHELCHGLGFIGSMSFNESNQTASYGFGTGSPFTFDTFAENRAGTKLTDTTKIKNNSVELGREVRSEDLYFNSPKATSQNNGRPKLFAPTQWRPGSSFSHLDDGTYPAGNVNSLMTSSASLREKNLDPGPIVRNMFFDMGWNRTAIVHDPLKDRRGTNDVVITAKILSDTTFDAASAVLVYTLDSLARDSVVVPLTRISGNDYQAVIRTQGRATTVTYYMSVKDVLNRTATTPARNVRRFVYAFRTGAVDRFGPVIDFAAPSIVGTGNSFVVLANVEDDFQEGVDTVVVNWSKNGIGQPSFGLSRYNVAVNNPNLSQGFNDRTSFIKESAFGTLAQNDRVRYQIVATDRAGNRTTLPTRNEGTETTSPNVPTTYELVATTIQSNVQTYLNDFNSPTTDFALVGFDINTPSGFNDGNLNTQEGYSNGKGLADPDPANQGRTLVPFDNDQIALLRSPIILDTDKANATISFDEVVLVEPGTDGTTFGDSEFWDYVVVEGSIDAGQTWTPLADGYDSRDNTSWLNRFNNTLSQGSAPISNGKGEQSLYKQRVINIYDGEFKDQQPGSLLLVRFRLFSDQWVRGWGWAIDNLRIQIPAPKPLANENVVLEDLLVSPNPTSQYLNLAYTMSRPQEVKVEVFKITGGQLLNEVVPTNGKDFKYQIDVRNYFPGTYVVKITGVEGFKAKKFVVN